MSRRYTSGHVPQSGELHLLKTANLSDTQGKEIFICMDSEASIKALMSAETTSRLVKGYKGTLGSRKK